MTRKPWKELERRHALNATETVREAMWRNHDPDPSDLAALADLEALVQAAEAITFAIWEGSPEEIAAADRFRAALARVKGDT